MQTRLKMSREGLDLLKEFEGLRLTAARLPDGRWTMGHGHTQYAREGATITEADAESFLVYDLIPVVAAVNDSVVPEISQNQFDALVCFAFNVGVEAFQQSEVLQRVNQERMTEAALAMAIWRAGAFDGRRVVLDALVRRRSAEEALLLGKDGRESPSDLIRPEIDPIARASLPVQRPVAFTIETSSVGEPAPEAQEPSPEAGVEAEMAEEPLVPTPADPVDNPSVAPDETTPDASDATVLSSASLSTRIYAPYAGTPFSPMGAALPTVSAPEETVSEAVVEVAETIETVETAEPVGQVEDEETTGLMEPPGAGAQIDEPPTVLILTPPPEVPPEPPARPDARSEAEGAGTPAVAEAPLFEQGEQPVISGMGEPVIYYEPEADSEDTTSRWSDTGAYVATGIVGLAAFGFGIAGFQLAGQEQIPVGTFDEKTVISWVLVAIGVVCVWVAAYNLFKRLGNTEEA